MSADFRRCLEQHLIDKASDPERIVPAQAWTESADLHIASAKKIVNDDPVGAVALAWLALHNLAKASAASIGFRLVDESHGKVADFIVCCFRNDLSDVEAGLVRAVKDSRNATIYGDPRQPNTDLTGRAINLAIKVRRLLGPVNRGV